MASFERSEEPPAAAPLEAPPEATANNPRRENKNKNPQHKVDGRSTA